MTFVASFNWRCFSRQDFSVVLDRFSMTEIVCGFVFSFSAMFPVFRPCV